MDDESGQERTVPDVKAAVARVWRQESAKIVATLAHFVGDVGVAEDLAQEAVADALAQWPSHGLPDNAAAWLTSVAKRKAIDLWRRRERLDARYADIAWSRALVTDEDPDAPPWDPDRIDDDVLRLVFVACHPVLAREAQVALTLRVVGGLSSAGIARAFILPVATVQQRIVRAKKALGAAHVPFEVPDASEFPARLSSVLEVVYLVFTEGYAASTGDDWIRRDLAAEALRLGRLLTQLLPREPEVHGLVALMELQASRFDARTADDGTAVLLPDQDRTRWDHEQISRGEAALKRADELGRSRHRGRGRYTLQAAIAQCHASARTAGDTDWERIQLLYEILGRVAPSPVVDLNRAVAVSMSTGPANALLIVDHLVADGRLAGYAPLYAVRGDLLERLGRTQEAWADFEKAAGLTGNDRERDLLLARIHNEGTPS
ncbi:MAG: polymerase subunit sigma-24 [Frondihabitans sp.]|nr:polymerase subunit sigma-24 [Frondihabitans sp.]